MHTGLTYVLEKMDYDLEKWLLECIVRQFGLCGKLRDEEFMTREEILKALEVTSEEPKKPTLPTEELLLKRFEGNKEQCKEEIKKREAAKVKYKEVLKKVNQLIKNKKNNSDMFNAILEYAKEQLEILKDYFNTESLQAEIDTTFETYSKREKAAYDRSLLFYENELEAYNREKTEEGCYQSYKALIKEVEEIFKEAV